MLFLKIFLYLSFLFILINFQNELFFFVLRKIFFVFSYLSDFLKSNSEENFTLLIRYIENSSNEMIPKNEEKKFLKYPEVNLYFDLWKKNLKWAQLFGLNLKLYKKEIRKRVWAEKKSFKKELNEERGIFFQMLFALIITGALAGTFSLSTQGSHLIELFFMLTVEGIGLILFNHRTKRLKIKIFEGYSPFLGSLYALEILSKLNLSPDTLWKESNLSLVEDTKFKDLTKHLTFLMSRYNNEGGSITREIGEIIEDVYFLKEDDSDLFLTKIKNLRVIYLSLFFVTPYFFFLLNFFKNSMVTGALGF